jgi:hypothetical protein
MTLMEQYGAERRSIAFPLCNALVRAATCFFIGFFLTAMIARGGPEKAFAQNDADATMERAHRELGRALLERAKEQAERDVLSRPDVAFYPMPLASMVAIQPLSQAAMNYAAGTLFDPAPLGGGTLHANQEKGPGRQLLVRPSLPNPEAADDPRADRVERVEPVQTSSSTTQRSKARRQDQVHPETTGSTMERGDGRRLGQSACPREAYPGKPTRAVLGRACVISVRG